MPDTEMSILQEVKNSNPCHEDSDNQMSPKFPVWLMQLQYQLDSYLYLNVLHHEIISWF